MSYFLFLKSGKITALVLCIILTAAVQYPLFCNTSENKASEETEIKVETITDILCVSAGMLPGTAHIIWSASKEVDTGTPLYTDVLSSVPSFASGIHTGLIISDWLSEKMINNYNDPYYVFMLKGILYSSLSGGAILAASLMPLFITSYYTGSIDFNFDTDSGVSGPLFASAAGGAGYGMVFGALLAQS